MGADYSALMNCAIRMHNPKNLNSGLPRAFLPEEQDAVGAVIAARAQNQPYWDIERARIGKSRRVPVELVVNGEAVARTEVQADGAWTEISFEHRIDRSIELAGAQGSCPVPIRTRSSSSWAANRFARYSSILNAIHGRDGERAEVAGGFHKT